MIMNPRLLSITVPPVLDFWFIFVCLFCFKKNSKSTLGNTTFSPGTLYFFISPPPDSSLPGQRTCSPAEFVQRQTTHYLQEWNFKARRAGPCCPHASLSSPEKPGIYHPDRGGNVTRSVKPPEPPTTISLYKLARTLPSFIMKLVVFMVKIPKAGELSK